MPIDTPAMNETRRRRVEEWMDLQAKLRIFREAELATYQTAVLRYLDQSHFDQITRKILREKNHPFRVTLWKTGETPLDGQSISKCRPAFILDHTGQWNFNRQQEFPGIRYSFRTGLDQTVLTVTICRDDKDCIFPYFFLTYEDGRLHQNIWQVAFPNPTDEQLSRWLLSEIK